MTFTGNSKRLPGWTLGIAAAAAVTPAGLFAATAHADSYCGPGPAGTHVCVTYENGANFGTTVHVWDTENNPGRVERCHYHSNAWNAPWDRPYDKDLSLNGSTVTTWWVPSFQTNTKWDVTVTCDNTGHHTISDPNDPVNQYFVQFF
jgi:hypothetical protein